MRILYLLYILTALLRYLRRTADPDLRFCSSAVLRICGSAVLRFCGSAVLRICEGTVKVQLLYIVNTIFSLIESIWNWNYWSLIYLFYCESQLPVDPTKEAKLKQRGLWVTIEKIICEWVPPASLGWYTIYIVTALSRYLRRTADPQNRKSAVAIYIVNTIFS